MKKPIFRKKERNKNKRKLKRKTKIVIIIISALIILIAAGIGTYLYLNSGESLSDSVKEKSAAYKTDLEDSAVTLTTNEKIEEYLCNWASSKGIDYTADTHGNVIMSVASSNEYKAAAPTVLVCNYDAKQIKSCISPMAVALYAVKNNESTGKLTVIFTANDGNNFSGIQSLNSKYFPDSANVFCLNGGDKAMFSMKTGAMSTYTLTKAIEKTEPAAGTKAFKIAISGLPGGTPDSGINGYPNPVKELSDLLAYFKNNAYIYQLANFSGGSDAGIYPQSAEMTIVISADTSDKFTERLDTEIENFSDDYSEDYPDAVYAYEEVELPAEVLTDESNNSFVSLMYTLDDGVSLRDDDDNLVSVSNIGAVISSESEYTIKVSSNSLSDTALVDIDNSQSTICTLSDSTYKKESTFKTWSSDVNSTFATDVADAFKEYSGVSMEYNDQVAASTANFVYEKNDKCNIVSISLYEEKIERYVGTIITFMLNQTHNQ